MCCKKYIFGDIIYKVNIVFYRIHRSHRLGVAGEDMKQDIRSIIRIILILIVIGSLVWLGVIQWGNHQRDQAYDEAEELFEEVEVSSVQQEQQENTGPTLVNTYTDPVIDELKSKSLVSLQAVNPDVIGWIYIPDTKVSYPLVQGTDNEYYLNNTWKDTPNIGGAIFMECGNNADMTDFNTIIYGHNMRGGSMFGTLKNYKKAKYWQEHPYIYIMHEGGVYRYEIFAAHKVQLNTIVYGMQIENPKQREELIRFALDYSAIDTGIEPTEDDKILTLSTCSTSAKARWVVQAVWNPEESYHKPQ